jgi:hypothetical protein
MKMRKFLKGLELPEDTIDSIMARYGELVTKDKEEISSLRTQIEEQNEKIKKAEAVNIEEIKKQAKAEGIAEGSKEIEVFKKQNALDKALSKYKAKDASILSKMLDMEKVKYNDKFEIVEGLEEQINSIKESHDYLFDSDKPLPTFTGANPNNNPNFNNKELSLGEALKEKFK